LAEVSAVLRRAQLPPRALALALKAFQLLAEAEAAVHGVSVDEVHFHEVGALDAIADIAAASLALCLLKPDRVVVRRIALGGGTVKTEHGILPVPAPATAKLLLGLPSISGPIDKELATPTGVALLRAFADEFGDLQVAGLLAGEGFGAGNLDLPDRPNAVRVLVFDQVENPRGGEADQVSVLSCAIDDMSGEILGALLSRLLEAGALDALCLPCGMKKSRQGMRLEVICQPGDADRLARLILRESSSLGVRIHEERRIKLGREFRQVMCRGEAVTVKLAMEGHRVLRAAPEFDHCLALAKKHELPLAQIYREVEALAGDFLSPLEG
jgi:pyridinium-3,5-bisthiocarboxylic acid mononucleotide nickel chelatase